MSAVDFQMDADWLPFHNKPSRPTFVLPEGAVDAHCHVFGPGRKFPFAPDRKYTPCDASKHDLYQLRDFLGFRRNVIVQATCHGSDNAAVVDAVQSSNNRARGVASVKPDISDDELLALHKGGIRGVRFNFVKRLVNVLPESQLMELANRIKLLGWHIVIYFEAPDLPDLYDFIGAIPTTVVIDHMGRPNLSESIDAELFKRFIKLMSEHPNVWSKVTCPERLSLQGPPGYDDFVPFGKLIVEQFTDRVLWGTDWPHPNMKSHMPNDGHLVDIIPRIAPTKDQQQKLLVENAMKLYWPEEVI